jgi:hypothetical protein
MITLDELLQKQKAGVAQIAALPDVEKSKLMVYCSLVSDELLKICAKGNKPVDEILANAVRIGFAAGMGVKCQNNQIISR